MINFREEKLELMKGLYQKFICPKYWINFDDDEEADFILSEGNANEGDEPWYPMEDIMDLLPLAINSHHLFLGKTDKDEHMAAFIFTSVQACLEDPELTPGELSYSVLLKQKAGDYHLAALKLLTAVFEHYPHEVNTVAK